MIMRQFKVFNRGIKWTLLVAALIVGSMVAQAADDGAEAATGVTATVAAEQNPFNKHQKEFYLSEEKVAFIRPGLVVEIVEASIDDKGVIEARVKITDPRGLPLDRDGIFTPGAVSTSFNRAETHRRPGRAGEFGGRQEDGKGREPEQQHRRAGERVAGDAFRGSAGQH